MHVYRRIGLLLVTLMLVASSTAYAQFPGAGSCVSNGSAAAELDVNNVRARLHNNGNLFYQSDFLYEVPKGSGNNSVFASGIWIGGRTEGDELRMAAARYENFEFRPGPLNEDGSPAPCNEFDRMWKVSKSDVQQYEATGQATTDLREWPAELGAPVIDGDGNPDNYSLSGGDRPDLIGDQAVWWIMNDVAPPHRETQTPPIGLEAQVQAFAFNQAGALGNTTFYKYTFSYEGNVVMEDVYLGLWADTDLGDSGDDYVGSDPDLGIGFTYNGAETDPTYGVPPALGYDFFQGPLIAAPGSTFTDPDGTVHQDSTRIAMEKFVYYNNDDSVTGAPENADDYYDYLRGIWKDGQPITFGGTGRDPSAPEANFMYPDDPPAYWSEEQPTPGGEPNAASDRRLLQSAGPFTLRPGDTQEIVFGIVWSQADGRLASLEKMKTDDALAQQVFDINFAVPAPPDAPNVEATPRDEAVTLTWDYTPQSNNYLGQYKKRNTLIPNAEDPFYRFEGFIVKQFASPADGEGEIVAIYDKQNDIARVLDESDPGGTVTVDIDAPNEGLQWSYQFGNLTNYTKYYFGVQPYAYNAESTPKIYRGPVNRITVQPSKQTASQGGSELVVNPDSLGQPQQPDTSMQAGQGVVTYSVVDPAEVTGDTYRVEFRELTVTDPNDSTSTATFTVYDVFNEATGEKVFDANEYVSNACRRQDSFNIADCEAPPQEENVFVTDGLSFDIVGPQKDWEDLVEVVDGEVTGSFYFPGLSLNPSGNAPAFIPSATGIFDADVGPVEAFFADGFNSTGVDRFDVISNGAPRDIEIRFVENPEENGQRIFNYFKAAGRTFNLMEGWTDVNADGDTTQHSTGRLPFQVWHVLPDGTEQQVEASVFSTDNDAFWDPSLEFNDVDFSGGNPPVYEPIFASNLPYDEALIESDPAAAFERWAAAFPNGITINRFVLSMFGGAQPPAPGTTLRFVTTKPNLPGDTFTIRTDSLAPTRGSDSLATVALDDIGIVPNPYRGASAYEVSQIVDVVKFTNMPERATIRVYTLSGRLIRTIEKNGPERQITWDLQTDRDLPIASGMYLVHVSAQDENGQEYGERILKFGVVKKKPQLNEF